MLKFDLPKNQSSIIKVIGVGGGGNNAVNHMYQAGIQGVDFIICNTDAQALESSNIPTKIQLGSKGLGAGSIPDVGREAATENIEEIKQILEKNTKMLFITAGMGGGTGTGAARCLLQNRPGLDRSAGLRCRTEPDDRPAPATGNGMGCRTWSHL